MCYKLFLFYVMGNFCVFYFDRFLCSSYRNYKFIDIVLTLGSKVGNC